MPNEIEDPMDLEQLGCWTSRSQERWKKVTANLQEPKGTLRVSYMLPGPIKQLRLKEILHILSSSATDYSGWTPFRVPSNPDNLAYPFEDTVECWIKPSDFIKYSTFWRASRDGKMFLIRGFLEDTSDFENVVPGTILDFEIPISQVGACLLHAEKLATNLGMEDGAILFQITYSGLQSRELSSIDKDQRLRHGRMDYSGNHAKYHGRYSRQSCLTSTIRVEIAEIRESLSEVLIELLSPLYEVFDFYEPTMQQVSSVVDTLTSK